VAGANPQERLYIKKKMRFFEFFPIIVLIGGGLYYVITKKNQIGRYPDYVFLFPFDFPGDSSLFLSDSVFPVSGFL
jgi:hypothetical protein